MFVILILAASCIVPVQAQELQVKININSQQVEGADKSVFENLQQTRLAGLFRRHLLQYEVC